MKKFLGISLILMLSASLAAFTPIPGSTEKSKQKIEITFNGSTGFTELVMIREMLAKKHIVLNYKKIEYTDDGSLKSLSFSVDCQDGFAGSASTDNLQKKGKFGFFRDYTDNASSPFGTGSFK